jgi:hypothetical protein
MKLKTYILIGLILLGVFAYTYEHNLLDRLKPKNNHCDVNIISQDVYSLTDVYSQEEKEAIAIKVLQLRKNRGEC